MLPKLTGHKRKIPILQDMEPSAEALTNCDEKIIDEEED